jgi:hypothetical protein
VFVKFLNQKKSGTVIINTGSLEVKKFEANYRIYIQRARDKAV